MEEYKLLKTGAIKPREYQLKIAKTAIEKNTLCILPTGLGKTYCAILVVANRLEKYPESKVLMLAPTRPLAFQHMETFMKFLNLPSELFVTATGKIDPSKRANIYKKVRVIFATPQTIANDLNTGILNLSNFSCLVVDECHRSLKRYPYPLISKKYMEQSKYPLILGLTASPGGTYERIEEIRRNLFVEAVEIRSEKDEDVKPYVKPVAREWIYVELPEEFKKIKVLLEEGFRENMLWLRNHNFLQTLKPSKKSLLKLQKKFGSMMMEGTRNYSLFWAIIRVAEAIKIEHALELLETQGISPLYEFFEKIKSSKKRTDRQLMKDPRIREAIASVEELYAKGIEHPKFEKLLYIIKDLVRESPNIKIIVFANYRSTVDKINKLLRENGIKSEILIGQAVKEGRGLTQQQQIEILKKFSEGEFNVLPTSSIGEEGIDYYADTAIFYEPVPSEIRALQRRGRVGRKKVGKVIFLITKDTRDQVFFWSAFHKEKRMKGILYDIRERTDKRKKTLLDWAKYADSKTTKT